MFIYININEGNGKKMRNRIRLFGLYLPFFILLTVAAITLKTIATIGYYNYNYHYFTNKSLPTIANSLVLAAIVFFIIYIISSTRSIRLIPSFSSPANYVPSAVVSASLVFMIIHLARTARASEALIIKGLSVALLVFAALSIVYFALNTIFIRTISARRANFGFFIIIFLGLYLAFLYFDPTEPINSPIKTADQLAYAFAAVFFLYEIRLSLGREKWKSYIIFGFIAALLTAYSAIPSLITYFATKRVVSNSIYESILTFSVFLFITLKLLLTDKLIEKKEAPFIEKLKEAAAKREAELNHTAEEVEEDAVEEEAVEEPDEKQISILDMKTEGDGELYDGQNAEEVETSTYEKTEKSDIPMNMTSEDYH